MVDIPRLTYIATPDFDYFKNLTSLSEAFIGDEDIKQKELAAKAKREAEPETWAAEYNLDPNATISNSYQRLQDTKAQVRMKFKDLDLAGGKDREAEEETSKIETGVAQGIFALLGPALGYMLGGNKMAAAGAQVGLRGAASMGEIAKRKEATAATERLAKEAEYTGRMGAIANQEKVLAQQAFKKRDREEAQTDRMSIQDRIDDRALMAQSRADARAGAYGGRKQELNEQYLENARIEEDIKRNTLRKGQALTADENKRYLGGISQVTLLDTMKKEFPLAAQANRDEVDKAAKAIDEILFEAPEAANIAGAFSRYLAKQGVNVNSPFGQFLLKAEGVGRQSAINQAGVATNQDVLEEIRKIIPSGLESPENYLSRMDFQIDSSRRTLDQLLSSASIQGRLSADELRKDAEKRGYLESAEAAAAKKRLADLVNKKLQGTP